MKSQLLVRLSAVLMLLLASCTNQKQPPDSVPWKYSTPEQQGFDSNVLVELLNEIDAEQLDIHSIVLMRRDHVFFEFYNYPYTAQTLHHTKSVGKSVLSALVGIALDNGQLKGLDAPILDSFPEVTFDAYDPRKADITLSDALTMQAGLNVGDDNTQILSDIISDQSWTDSTWAQDMIDAPGQRFNYSSFVSHLIAQVTQRAIDHDLSSFAKEELFDPIGMGHVQIENDPAGDWFGSGPLWITSQDLLRFGRLYLANGKWDSEQVVPKDWVRESTRNQIGNQTTPVDNAGYGYQWWVFDGAYAAIGVGGQMIMVFPDLDFVAVITRADPSFDLVDGYILRALTSTVFSASPNPSAVTEINRLIDKLAKPRQSETANVPIIDYDISGQSFTLVSNDVPNGVPIYHSLTLHTDADNNLTRLQLETDTETLDLRAGTRNAPMFTPASDRGLRPDKDSQYATSAWWSDNNTLLVDIHEVGYPIKERWTINFNNGDANLIVRIRGATAGVWSYVATREATNARR